MRDPSPDPVDSTVNDNDTPGRSRWTAKALVRQAEKSHRRLPGIRKIPLPAIGIILFIAFLNVVVWIAAAIVLVRAPHLSMLCLGCLDANERDSDTIRKPYLHANGTIAERLTLGSGHRSLVSNAVLSYTLGLRHAFDADHISVRSPPPLFFM